MSRPNISYPSPIPGPSTSSSSSYPQQPLEPSPYLRQPAPRQASGPSRAQPNVLDSIITKLLVTTKQLLQGLEQWSQGIISEEDVSDVYVKLGNGFEHCVNAFHRVGISTRELDSIPQDLRECLEQALAETPSQETLNVYLPDIRSIIFNLLNGLKQKQAHYKRITQERTEAATPPPAQAQPLPPPQVGHVGQAGLGGSGAPGGSVGANIADEMGPGSAGSANRTRAMMPESTSSERLSARSVGSITSQGGSDRSTSPTPMSMPGTKIPSSSALAERNTQRSGLPSRPAPPDAFRPSRRAPEGPRRSVSPQPGATMTIPEPPQPLRFQLQDPGPVRSPPKSTTTPQMSNPMSIPAPTPVPAPTIKPTPPRPDRYSRDSFGNRVSRFSADSDMTIGSPVKSPVAQTPPRGIPTLIEEPPSQPISPPQSLSLAETLPPMLPTINIAPSISLQETALAPSPPIEAPVDVPPETRATLAALQRADALERRASKRFSSYTFNKMLPSSPGKKQGSGTSPQRPVRRVDRAPPMPSLPEGLRRESESEGESISHLSPNAGTAALPPERAASPLSDGSSSSVRIVRTPPPDAGESTSQLQTPRQSGESASATQQSQSQSLPSNVAVFLQIGRQVKKAMIDLPVTLSALRLLFMERFDYDPGMEDFPDVYVRDNRTGVHFELEDMEDLKEGAILSLSIEPLDQVKQHFDHTFATLMAELKEMKTSLDHSRRISAAPANSFLAVSPSSSQAANARQALAPIITTPKAEPRSPSPLPRSMALAPLDASREAELRTQADELQNLRRDLAVLRQTHVDFLQETKESFGKLRVQNNSMREVVKTKMGGSRAILDNSKAKLEQQCQDTIQAVEDINDVIDAARLDAYKRFVTPSKAQMSQIQDDLKRATEMVESFARDVTSVDPTWRATWQLELSRVMEEQKLLSHQTKLAQDLKNDIKDATEMLANVSVFVEQRAATRGGAGGAPTRGFRPPSPDESGGIPNLLMEIRTKESDPQSRLKAIEAQQKARERERANKTDEFSSELGSFVKGRRLKKTGGTEEAERIRQRRHEQTLKRMLNGEAVGTDGGPVLTPQTTGASAISPTASTSGTGGASTPLTADFTGSTSASTSLVTSHVGQSVSPTPRSRDGRASAGSIEGLGQGGRDGRDSRGSRQGSE